tara:strand:- start:2 stop:142 length:141 start_codon:yes stop_codon:yes gene_type:complete
MHCLPSLTKGMIDKKISLLTFTEKTKVAKYSQQRKLAIGLLNLFEL